MQIKLNLPYRVMGTLDLRGVREYLQRKWKACAYCSGTTQLTTDQIVSKRGFYPENMVLACYPCITSRQGKDLTECFPEKAEAIIATAKDTKGFPFPYSREEQITACTEKTRALRLKQRQYGLSMFCADTVQKEIAFAVTLRPKDATQGQLLQTWNSVKRKCAYSFGPASIMFGYHKNSNIGYHSHGLLIISPRHVSNGLQILRNSVPSASYMYFKQMDNTTLGFRKYMQYIVGEDKKFTVWGIPKEGKACVNWAQFPWWAKYVFSPKDCAKRVPNGFTSERTGLIYSPFVYSYTGDSINPLYLTDTSLTWLLAVARKPDMLLDMMQRVACVQMDMGNACQQDKDLTLLFEGL